MKETDEPEARATEPASLEAQQRRNDPAADAGAAGESTKAKSFLDNHIMICGMPGTKVNITAEELLRRWMEV